MEKKKISVYEECCENCKHRGGECPPELEAAAGGWCICWEGKA